MGDVRGKAGWPECPRFLATIATAAVLAWVPAYAGAETLKDAFAAAYQSNPDLLARRAALRAQDETVSIANSGYRPTVSSTAEIERQRNETNISSSAGETRQDFSSTNETYRAAVAQPLFRGFQTVNDVRSAENNVYAGREQLRAAEIATFIDVAGAYMDVLRDRAVLGLTANQVTVLERQLQASRDRFEVGDVTRTDVAQSEARLATAQTNRIAAQGALDVSLEAYRRLVGQVPGDLASPALDMPLPQLIDDAIALAVETNPDLAAARFAEKAAQKDVASAKGAVLPSLDASASITRTVGDRPIALDVGTIETTTKVAGVTLTVPLYQSGAEYAAVRRAQQLRSQRMLEIASAERQVVERVRTAWVALKTAQATIESAKLAISANDLALEGVRQEQMVGTRTILDVLDAEQELLDSKVALTRAERDEVVAVYQLLGAMGQLDARALDLAVEIYDPAENLDRVRHRWFGWE